MLVTGYINNVAGELELLHKERRICHLDVRPDMIEIDDDGKAVLKESSVSQSFSEQGAAVDFRDLKAVQHYLLTGKRVVEGAKPQVDISSAEIEVPGKNRATQLDSPTENIACQDKVAHRSRFRHFIVAVVSALFFCVVGLFLFHKLKSNPPKRISCEYGDFHYEGLWQDGKPNGQGTARYSDGRFYEGNFCDGLRSGSNARFIYADGNVFEGTFAADTIQRGKVVMKSVGLYFVGDFSGGKPFTGYWYRTSDNVKVEKVEQGKEIVL